MKIILASKSPRRKEILSMITNNFDIIVSNVEEKLSEKLVPFDQVKNLAYIKAKAVFDDTKSSGDRIVIGSDTIVVKNDKIYGKPKNFEEAKNMLNELKNAKHEVMTGLSCVIELNVIPNVLLFKDGKVIEILDADVTNVYIGEIEDFELENWIASGEAYDKAGGYAIQGKFGVFVEKIEGSYFTVVGLPLHKVYNVIKDYLY